MRATLYSPSVRFIWQRARSRFSTRSNPATYRGPIHDRDGAAIFEQSLTIHPSAPSLFHTCMHVDRNGGRGGRDTMYTRIIPFFSYVPRVISACFAVRTRRTRQPDLPAPVFADGLCLPGTKHGIGRTAAARCLQLHTHTCTHTLCRNSRKIGEILLRLLSLVSRRKNAYVFRQGCYEA